LLVTFDPLLADENTLETKIAGLKLEKGQQKSGKLVEIPVVYDGEDLDDVAALLKIDREEVIRRHTESHYQVAFCGFAPGFAYLTGGDPLFNVPRRASPRKSIPAGSVALAGKFGGVYPQPSPGGWQLIGRTDVKMFDLDRDPPSLLKPGDRVHFVDVTKDYSTRSERGIGFSLSRNDEALLTKAGDKTEAPKIGKTAGKGKTSNHDDRGISATEENLKPQENAIFKLVTTLMPVTFQDRGRLCQSSQGLSPSGALDQKARPMPTGLSAIRVNNRCWNSPMEMRV